MGYIIYGFFCDILSMLICNSPCECVHNKIFVENVIWKCICLVSFLGFFFLIRIFFFWVEFVCFCFSHFKVGIMKGLLFIGVVAMQIIQLEMNRQELWKSTQLCIKV